jgi:hypothetical protein
VHEAADLSALKSISDNLTLLGAVGARTPAAYWLAWLAEALLHVGAAGDALGAIEHGLGASATGLDHFYDPELYRLKAGALSALSKPDAEVEAALEQSLRLARERQHVLFELKTATDLAERTAKRGDPQRGYELLKSVLDKLDHSEAPVARRGRSLLEALHP